MFWDIFTVPVGVSQQKSVQPSGTAFARSTAESVCGCDDECNRISDFAWRVSGGIVKPSVLSDY